jgi:hypothetical protein
MSSQVNFALMGELMKAKGYECSPRCCAISGVAFITSLALFIIGCVGAAGAFPGSTIGWVTVALAGGGFVLNLALGNFKQRKFELILGGLLVAALIPVGVLGGVGILSATQVGWGILGTSLATSLAGGVYSCLKRKQIEQLLNNLH